MSRAGRALSHAAPVALALACDAGPGLAQVGLSNLLIGQSGNIPFQEPADRTGLYDQLNLEYRFESVRLGLRFETDQNSENSFIYHTVTQRWAEWTDERLRLRVGNLYSILGRGLIHRSFEVPGVVLDQPGIQSRYGFSRDLDGVLLEGALGPASLRLLGGQPNGGDTSPGIDPSGELRYRGQASGGQAALRLPRDLRLGAAFLRYTNTGADQHTLGSGFVELDPVGAVGVRSVSLPLYFEYAQQDRSFGEWWRFETDASVPHALYAGANVLWSSLALSAEWKDYDQFRLGTNDPPSLVREHSWVLLNRATHVLDADDERGFQLEGSWSMPAWGGLVLNLSRSDNSAGARFEERFAEARVAPAGWSWEVSGFLDGGQDEFVFVEDRKTWGAGTTVRFRRDWSTTFDVEEQRTERGPDRFLDQYAALGVARAGWGSFAIVHERSSDPAEEDPDRPGEPRRFISGLVSARLSERHEAALFVGERRGGLACTAGTCYQVAAFKGAEFKLTTRL